MNVFATRLHDQFSSALGKFNFFLLHECCYLMFCVRWLRVTVTFFDIARARVMHLLRVRARGCVFSIDSGNFFELSYAFVFLYRPALAGRSGKH